MRMSDPVLDEVLIQWPAWQVIVHYTTGGAARDADPAVINEALALMSVDDLVGLAHAVADAAGVETIDEAIDLMIELRAMAIEGRRPRYGAEAGLTFDAFSRHRT